MAKPDFFKKLTTELQYLSINEKLKALELIINQIKAENMINPSNIDFHPSDYKGIYKNLNLDLDKEAKELREEWNRNI